MIENLYSEVNTPIVERRSHGEHWENNNGLDDLMNEGRDWIIDNSKVHAKGGSVFEEELIEKYLEPVADEVLALVDSLAKDNFDDSWEQIIESMVVPLSLEDYWNAFWANDAPYFVPAFQTRDGAEIVKASDWKKPVEETSVFYNNTPVDRQRVIKREVEPKGGILLRFDRQTEYISQIERSERKITLKVVKVQTGSQYAKTYE